MANKKVGEDPILGLAEGGANPFIESHSADTLGRIGDGLKLFETLFAVVSDYGIELSPRDFQTLAVIAQGLRMAADHEKERFNSVTT